MFKIKKFFKSFKYAGKGFKTLLHEEQNFLFDFFVALVVLFFCFYFPLTAAERGIIILAVFLVLILEIINSTFERVVDVLEPRLSETVKKIKDFMSLAVLLMAVCAIILGLLIFWKYVF